MTTREQIAQQALALAPEDRTYIADLLESSLSNGEFASQEVAAAWVAEIERRIDAYDRGATQATDVAVALERMRRTLEEHRTRKAND